MNDARAEEDGWEARARVGVVVPHADVGPESEFQAIAPDGIFIHGSRVYFGAMRPGGEMDPKIPHDPVRAFVEPPLIDDAVQLLAASPIDVIALGFTSSAYVLGASGEKELFARLARHTRGIPLTGTTAAAVRGFTALGVHSVAIVNPPWFDDRLCELGARYFTDQGFEVVHHDPCGLPSNQRLITPEALSDWIRTAVADHRPEAVLVAGNGIRAVGVISALEKELDFSILTANQVLFWHALHLAGAGDAARQITGYGRLFETVPGNGTATA
ncbi:MAG TPA: hypothetical protein VGX23_03260 [Actinocrinis sp.]|nr:hypothetical protein [Actinocrinis sp.]